MKLKRNEIDCGLGVILENRFKFAKLKMAARGQKRRKRCFKGR